jgi:hypothetical protein
LLFHSPQGGDATDADKPKKRESERSYDPLSRMPLKGDEGGAGIISAICAAAMKRVP